MPEIFINDNGETSESVGFDGHTETQRQETAKAELVSEQYGTPSPLILGKFTSPDAVADAYRNLESETGRLRAELAALKAGGQAAPTPPVTGEALPPTPAGTEAAPPVGDPAPPTPAAPAPPATPAAPQSLSIEQQEVIRSAVLAQAGGEEEFGRLATWATHNLPQDRLARFNAALQEGRSDDALTALKSFQFDRIMQMGYEPPLLGGSSAAAPQGKAFASEAEVTRAMNDPRYMGPDADPAYVDEVYRRIQASGLWG